jgi:tetratricopeptide (TPR) repeat protein
MLKELLRSDVYNLYTQLVNDEWNFDEPDLALYGIASALYKLMLELEPNHPEYTSRLAITYHLNGELRTAGKYYRNVLELDPPQPLSDAETSSILLYAPILHTNKRECFKLMDVVAIHHPIEPIIAYHLFWEDDYDFPDDYEPCDHEVVWVEYDVESRAVRNVWCFFHSYVLSTEQAVTVANRNNGRAAVYIEWGKHGSLLDGWAQTKDEQGRCIAQNLMVKDHQEVSRGGRVPTHPLKRWWPKRFEGNYEDYLDFSEVIDTRDRLVEKPMMAKTKYANAVLQQHFLRYNFHPKYDWPWQVSQVLR